MTTTSMLPLTIKGVHGVTYAILCVSVQRIYMSVHYSVSSMDMNLQGFATKFKSTAMLYG